MKGLRSNKRRTVLSHNACYAPTSDCVLMKKAGFRNDVNEFIVELWFDRPTGLAYYTIDCCGAKVRSCAFFSCANAASDVRAFLARANCTSTDFQCGEYKA